MSNPDIIIALKPVIEAFEKLGVKYYVSGSVASSVYGIARATLDVDIVADLSIKHVKFFVKILQPFYYIDEKMILDAISHQTSFNLIHLDTMLKIDIFIAKDIPYHQQSMQRKRKDTLDENKDTPEIYVSSPEDIILNKLEWFRKGGEVSETQWKDILGILKVQKSKLDMEYLQQWAVKLNLNDLLKKILLESGIMNNN